MLIPSDSELLAEIEKFLDQTEMKPTRFGLEVMEDGALVSQLRNGRSLSLRNAGKVIAYIRAQKSPSTAK